MAPVSILSYLVHPGRGETKPPPISGARVPTTGPLFTMLSRVYERADNECQIAISFRSDDGVQTNECRDLLVTYLRKPGDNVGREIAARLQSATSHRSGSGLLFLIAGEESNHHRLVVARFPADEGVLAEQNGSSLSIQFVERVFMKSTKSYKSVLYKSASLDAGFWRGRATDRQINGPRETARYWIDEFLASTLATPGAAGSKRFADAMRQAVGSASIEVKQELIAAIRLIPNHGGRRTTAAKLLERVGVSEEGVSLVRKAMSRHELMDESFQMDAEEFSQNTAMRSVELDNGAMLTAHTTSFDDVFKQRRVAEGRTVFETEGHIVDQRIRKQV